MINLTTYLDICIFVLGLLIGSFTNVIVARFPWETSIVTPRSRCPKCETLIRWYDNIPLLSYAILGGKCRKCSAPISLRYPVIELLSGVLYLAAFKHYGLHPLFFIRDLPFITALVAVTFIDLEHRLIPDIMSIGGTAWGLVTAFGLGWAERDLTWQACWLGALAGFGIFYAFSWAYFKMTDRIGLGGGDIKLLAMLGAFLGPMGVFHSILISSVFGSLVGITWGIVGRKKNVMQLAIPYGPFLVVGGLYYYLWGELPWLQFTTPT